jgi:hypothetical protein
MFILNGVDNVTISGIDLQENAANTTSAAQMEWGYALLKTGALNGAQNNTIRRSTVTLNQLNTASVGIYAANHTTASTTTLTLTALSGTNSGNRFFNNTVTNCYTGYSVTGFAASAPFDLYDNNNQIGVDGVSTRRSQVTQFGGGTLTANGVNASAQNNFRVFATYFNNTGGAIHTSTLNGINITASSNANIDIYNDTLTLTSNATTSNLIAINNSAGGAGAGNTLNIYNNVVDGCTYPTATSGLFRGISTTATATTTNVYNNKVTNNNLPGTGEFSGISCTGSSVNIMLLQNIYDNIVSGNLKTGAGGTMNMVNASGSTAITNFYNNQLFNNSAANTSGGVFGYYNFAFGLQENIYNNQIYNNTGGSGEVTMIHARSGSGPTNKEIYGNLIHSITANTTNIVSAIGSDYGTVTNIYRNNIYNISNTSTTGGTPATVGINVGSNVNALTTVHNNMISDLKAPNATNTFACIMGIWLNGALTGSVMNAYYNTVYLNATGTGTNFGTSALYIGPNAYSTDIRNNIFVNISNATGTGLTRCITRSTPATTNYALTSGYNCLWAGTPSATNLIYHDFTNSDQTLQAFKNRVGPREQSSFSELPPFVNVATTPYDLHLQTSVATQCQGGATPIAGITTDFDNLIRNLILPDVGADEFTGITTDLASPNIQYTLLTNSSVAATRVLTSFATITDPSGINTTAGTRPRIYYKRSTNANTFNTNTNATDGWKYVEAGNTASPFSFTIDYSLLFGGAVVAGDVIQYFVVAQDLNSTPRIGLNNGGFTAQPASVNLSAAEFPLNNTINQYTIVAVPLSGTINVGPAETITSLTNAGGIFQLINSATLSGNLVVNVTGDLTAETGTVALNQWAEEGLGNYTVTIQPSAAVVRTISGSSAAAALIRLDGADRVTIDGRFGGTGTFFLLRNTSNSAPTVAFLNDAHNNTLRNSTVESGNTATSAALGGAIHIGTTTGTAGNDNITINLCEIRDRTDVPGSTPAIGINCQGTATSLLQYNNNINITNNNIHDWFLVNSSSQFGLNIGSGNTNFTITGNSFYQTAVRTQTASGAVTRAININFTAPVNSNGGHTINGNFVGGTAPGATGGDMTLTVSGVGTTQTFAAISVITGLIPNSINGNTIRKIDYTTNAPTANSSMFLGMNLGQGIHNVGTLQGNVIGDAAGNDHIKITINTGGTSTSFLAGILAATTNGTYTLTGNTVGGFTINGTTAATVIWQGIQLQGTPSSTINVTNNLVGSTTTATSIRNLNAASPVIGFGIRQVITSGAALNLTNNTVQGYSDASTAATSANYGILLVSTVGGSGTLTVTGNTVRNQAMAGGAATPVINNVGIAIQNLAGNTHSFTSNVIAGLSNTNTGAFSGYALGFQSQSNTLGGTLSRNQIWDITNLNTGTPGIAGIYYSSGSNWTVSNNMISLTNGTNTNNVDLNGIVDVMSASSSAAYYYNSVYLGGSVTAGASNTSAFNRAGNTAVTVKNNLLVNNRTGGTGNHVALSNTAAATSAGWSATASSNNAFVVSDTTKVGLWNATTYSLGGWRTISGGDLNSVRAISTVVTPAALFVNTAIGDLHNNTSIFPEAVGTPIPGITIDFDNQARNALAPTAGADERACSPIVFTLASQTNVSCNGGNNGSATVSGTGGNFITYSWAPSGGNAATATGLAAGTYTCTISNPCGSTGSVTVTITQPTVLAATNSATNVSCNGGSNGSATVSPSGGTPGYTYNWAPSGGTAATASGLTPGSYTCTITDANGCTTTSSVSITEPSALGVTSAQSNVSCNAGSNGSATVSVSGGTPGYTYSWAPSGGTAATAGGLTAGSYTCTITDANGCIITQSVSITEPSPLSVTSSQTNVSCNGGSDGTGTVSVSGGTPGYTYSWAPSGSTSATATGLSLGSNICTITDANGCIITQSVIITEPAALSVTSTQTNVSCNGGSNGTATVNVSGGTPGYTYLWSNGDTTATATGLLAGAASCTITDTNNCTITFTVNITEPSAITATASATNVSCSSGSDGSVTVNATGGTPGYTYLWNTGDTTASVNGLVAGAYSVVITDANGCTNTQSVTIAQPAAVATTVVTSVNPTTCGGNDGSIDISVSGGVSPYAFQWSNSANTEDISGLTAGVYSVIVTDNNGCTDSIAVTLNDPALPNVAYSEPIDSACSNITAPFALTGGSPAGGTYTGNAVNNGIFTPSQITTPGYTVITYTYTDPNGCVGTSVDSIWVEICSAVGEIGAGPAFTLFPNPNNGSFTLQLGTEMAANVEIYDMLGKLVVAQRVQTGTLQQFRIEASGTYFVTVVTNDGKRSTQRVVITD